MLLKIRVKSLGLKVRDVRGDPDCIELELAPKGADLLSIIKKSQEVAKEVRELRAIVRDQNLAMREICHGVKEIADGLRDFGALVQYVSAVKEADRSRARREPDRSVYN